MAFKRVLGKKLKKLFYHSWIIVYPILSYRQSFMYLSMSLSRPIEKRINPSVNPISACSSRGISLEVEVPER
jgi:hypothetical protein